MSRITDVEIYKFMPQKQKTSDKWKSVYTARPISKYPEFDSKEQRMLSAGATVVKITTEDGLYGYGATGTGLYRGAAEIMSDAMRPFLLDDCDADEIEKIWDLNYKATVAIGRKGLPIHALSAIDIALWDIKGKKLGLPVYQLLGGKVRDKIKVYATGPDLEMYKKLGYKANKIPIPCGPVHGREGMKKNLEAVERVVKIMGEDTEIMLDCWMGWDFEYTVKMARMLKDYNIRWIEEPLVSTDYDGFKRLKYILNSMGILLTTGEHEFTRWGARELVENGCVDILQCDIMYCGGLSEIRKIAAYCKAHNVMLVPHSHGMPVFHFSISSLVSPFAETLMNRIENPLFFGVPGIKDGYVEMPEGITGLGYELNTGFSEYKMV